jgi:Fur family peroxide stress response transcriptional regulator
MADKEVIKILVENNLKVTPQRIAVLEVIMGLENHPSADNIIDYIRLNFPHVPIGTVYKILDAFVEKGIIHRIKTENGILRYDAVKEPHHHLYCTDSEHVEDFFDEYLTNYINKYFKKKKIPNFKIEEIKLQIVGKYLINKL